MKIDFHTALGKADLTIGRFGYLWGVSPNTLYHYSKHANPTRTPPWIGKALLVMQRFPEVRRFLEKEATR